MKKGVSSETLLLVDVVKRILAAQSVPVEQLNSLITGIGETLIALRGGTVAGSASAVAPAPVARSGGSRHPVAAKSRAAAPVLKFPMAARDPLPSLSRMLPLLAAPNGTSAIPAAGDLTSHPTITRLPTRGRGRPRLSGTAEGGRQRVPVVAEKVAQADQGETRETAAPAEPQPPRLLRRSEIEGPAAVPGSGLMPTTAAENVVHRGIVRWFDPKKQLGALRIAGYAEGISIDSEILRKAGIVRLYKGQEIEARVRIDGSLVQLLSLSLAGAVPSNAERAEGLFGPRRQSRAPVVEMKRDALRKTAARLEAEQLFSRGMRVGQSGTTDK